MTMIDMRRFIALNVLALLIVGCGPDNNSTQSTSIRDASSSVDSSLDLGDDWDASSRGTNRRIGSGGTAQRDETGRWTIVLGTFSGDAHAQQARAVHQQLTASVADVRSARVHSTARGSMLIYGRYTGADDPRAVADLARIKQTTFNDLPVFARAFLTPLPSTHAEGTRTAPASAHDLMQVRKQFPDVDPLYTLQVALWGDFDSGRISLDEIRRQAEAHASRLRSEGHEAYVYHDDHARQSLITVGLFNRSALDASTGEFSHEVRTLMRRFPAHLVNGEELQEPVDRRRPSRETRVQKPFLVVVPKLN